jgi:major membrane immunogen (membrane-anchored lipoprotein)
MKKAICILAAVLLVGCGGRTDEQAKAMLSNPDVNEVGTFDGCEVKYVDRGYHAYSFYIARCGNTTTATRNYTEQSGKTTVNRRSTVIAQEIQKLEAEKAAAVTKEKALEKLSPEEKALLGVK